MATLINVEDTRKDLSRLLLHPRFCTRTATGDLKSMHVPSLVFRNIVKEHSFPPPSENDEYALVTEDIIRRVIQTELHDMNYTFCNGHYVTNDKQSYHIHGIAESMYCDYLVYVYTSKVSRSRPSSKIVQFIESVQKMFKRELGMYLNVKLIKMEGGEQSESSLPTYVVYNFTSFLDIV